jgi:hypothetical protein
MRLAKNWCRAGVLVVLEGAMLRKRKAAGGLCASNVLARRALILSATCAAINFLPALATAQTPSIEETVVNAFLGNCALNLPNLDKIRAASRTLGWKSLPRDAATMMGPIDPSVQFEGWMVSDLAVRYLVGISVGRIGVQPVVTCTVANPDLKQDALLGDLHQKLKLETLNDVREAGQRYRAWTTEVNGYSMLISLTTMQNENSPGGSLSAAVKLR